MSEDRTIVGYEEPEEFIGYNSYESPYMIDTETEHVQNTHSAYSKFEYPDDANPGAERGPEITIPRDTSSKRLHETKGTGKVKSTDLPQICPGCKGKSVRTCSCGNCLICGDDHRWYKKEGKLRVSFVDNEHN